MTTPSTPPSIREILELLHHPMPWQIAALLQDNVVWNSLSDRKLLATLNRRLNSAGLAQGQAAELSPASIALDALEQPGLLRALRSSSAIPLPESLLSRIPSSETGTTDESAPVEALRDAGLRALGLYQRHVKNPAEIVPVWENGLNSLPNSDTVLACLYGMLPKPALLLSALLKTEPDRSRALHMICHILLSNPLNPEALQKIFQRLLTQAGLLAGNEPAAPSNLALEVIDILSELRPELGARLAGWLVAEIPASTPGESAHPASALSALLKQTRLHQLNGNPEQAMAAVNQAITQSNLLLTELQTASVEELRRSPSNPEQAIQQLEHLKGADEPRPHPWIVRQRTTHLSNLAAHLLGSGHPAQAVEASHLLHKRAPANAHVHFLLGASLLARAAAVTPGAQPGEALQAVRHLELAAALEPHNLETLRNLAGAYTSAGLFEDGMAVHEQIIAEAELFQDSGLLRDILALSECAIQAGSPIRAIEAANQALTLMEGYPANQEQLGQVYGLLGKAHFQIGDLSTASQNFQQAVQSNPQDASAWLDLAACAAAAGHDAAQVDTLMTATQAIPQRPELHLALGQALFEQNMLTEAQQSLAAAYELCKANQENRIRPQVALAYGRALLALNHQEQAGVLLEEAHNLRPVDPAAAGLFGRWLLAQGQAGRAASVLEIALSDVTRDPTLALGYATAVLKSEGDARRAIQALEAVLPALSAALEDEALSLLAEAHSQLQEYQVAFDLYRAVLLRSPQLDQQKSGVLSRGFGCAALALSAAQPELKQVAHAALQDAASLCPDHAPTRRFLAEAAWVNGLENEAWAAAKASLEYDRSLDGAMWFANQVLQRSSASSAHTEVGLAAQAASTYHPELVKRGIQALRACKQNGRLSNPALLLLAQLFRQSSQTSNALGALKAILSSPAASAAELEQAAGQFLALEQPDSALKALIQAAQRSQTPAHQAALLVKQSELHAELGDQSEAIAALNAAIEIMPYEVALHIHLVKLLTGYHQYDQADQAAQRALGVCNQCNGPSPDLVTAALYSQLAELQLATGRLVQSYAHAVQAIQVFAKAAPQDDSNGASPVPPDAIGTAFAAAIQAAHGLLLPGRASNLIRNPLFSRCVASETLNTTLHCLSAHHALANQAELQAAESLTPALAGGSTPHPWAKILQALLLLRSHRDQEDLTEAKQLVEQVMQDLQKPAAGENIGMGKAANPLMLENLKEAFLSLTLKPEDWERLVHVMKAVSSQPVPAESTPASTVRGPELNPLASLVLVQVLVARAEYRRLCLDLEAVQAAPLADEHEGALCFGLLQNIEAALLNARQEAAALPAENLSCDLDENTWSPAVQTVERWKTRAAAVFGHPFPSAWITWDPSRLLASGMETDAAACLAYLKKPAAQRIVTGGLGTHHERPLPFAHQLGQAHANHALVQIQAALLTAPLRPENARAFANRAISAAHAPRQERELVHPLAPMAYAVQALVCQQLSLPELALQAYEAALRFLPEEPRWHLACARLLSQQAAPAEESSASEPLYEAIQHLEEAVRLEPGFSMHSLALSKLLTSLPKAGSQGRLQSKEAQGDLGVIRRGLRALERASKLVPTNAAIWLALARAQAYESSRYGEMSPKSAGNGQRAAEACARRAAELAHKANQADVEAAALCLTGQIALQAEDAETAYRAGRQAAYLLNAAANSEQAGASGEGVAQLATSAVLIQVEALEMLERYADALELLETRLGHWVSAGEQEATPDDETAEADVDLPLRLKHAYLVSKVHGPEAGIERLERIQNQTQRVCPQVEAALAFDLAAAGRADEAIQRARQALAHMAVANGETGAAGAGKGMLSASAFSKELLPSASPAELHTLVGRLLEEQGQLDQAVHHYTLAIKSEPVAADAYLGLAEVYGQQRQYNRALQTLEQAIRVAPLDPRPYHMAGVAYREGRDYARAAELLRRAADLDPENAEIRRHLLAVMAAGFFNNATSNADVSSAAH
jgi:tetratricopeptide (TPR) repeat protein